MTSILAPWTWTQTFGRIYRISYVVFTDAISLCSDACVLFEGPSFCHLCSFDCVFAMNTCWDLLHYCRSNCVDSSAILLHFLLSKWLYPKVKYLEDYHCYNLYFLASHVLACTCDSNFWLRCIRNCFFQQESADDNGIVIQPVTDICVSRLSVYFTVTLYTIQGALLSFGSFLAWSTRNVSITWVILEKCFFQRKLTEIIIRFYKLSPRHNKITIWGSFQNVLVMNKLTDHRIDSTTTGDFNACVAY